MVPGPMMSILIYRKIFKLYYAAVVVRGCLVINVLDCQSRGSGFKFRPGQKFAMVRDFGSIFAPLPTQHDEYLTVRCHWEDETEGEDWPRLYLMFIDVVS